MTERLCLGCGVPLERRDGESPSAFAARKNCNRTCADQSRGAEPGKGTLYRSRFGGGWVNAGQFLAESMCDRLARRDRRPLSLEFWTREPWKKAFLRQLFLANKLLKACSAAAVTRALRTPEGRKAYSLGAPWLPGLAATEQALLDAQEKSPPRAAPEPELEVPAGPPRPAFVLNPSLLSRLRSL